MIPKIIHYCWFGGAKMPNSAKKCIETWKKKCPEYKIQRWDESNFDINSHPFVQAAYKAKAWAFVSDYVRLKVVYAQGGIYLDTDVELLKNLDFLLEHNFFMSIQQYQHLCNTGLGFGAERKSDIVFKMLNKYDEIIFDEEKKEEIACPYLNNVVLMELGYSYVNQIKQIADGIILPPYFMDPEAPGQSKDVICSETISVHHYTASWASKKQQLRRKVVLIIGQRRIRKIKNLLEYLVKRGQ